MTNYNHMIQLLKNNKGITLVEVLVAIGIFTLIIGGITAMLLFSWKSNKIVWEQLKTQNEGRKVIQDFTNELRIAAASSIGSYVIESASSSQIIFYSDVDHDSLRDRIRYFFVTSTLKRGVVKPAGNPPAYNSSTEAVTDVAHDVVNASNTIFTYYDSSFVGSGSPLSSPIDVTKIRVVGISLELEEDPQASPVPFYIESKVVIRNLKDN